MWKIMVVDDEPKIRRGLCRFIEKCGLPLTVCAKAGDGASALRLLEEHRPDIVLLDICMPHMDGLAFLSELKAHGLTATKCIVITGFDDFSFAQASVSLRAFAYLLKPINEAELLSHLQNAITELAAEQQHKQKTQQALNQIEHNQTVLQELFAQKWMAGTLGTGELAAELDFWRVEWPEQAFLILVRPNFKLGHIHSYQEQSLMLFGVANMASELLEELDVRFCGRDDRGCCAIVAAKQPTVELLGSVACTITQHLHLHCPIDCAPLTSPGVLHGTLCHLKERFDELENASPVVEEIKSYIERNYASPSLSLAHVAVALCVSQPTISRLMKTALQTTFVDYLTAKRMSRAIELLPRRDLKLSLIAKRVGYVNQHYFSAVFKKHTGVSPSVYREKHFK